MAPVEILYRSVVEAVNQTRGTDLAFCRAFGCAGGDINHAAVIDCGSTRLFVKYHTRPPAGMFEAEYDALAELAASDAVRVPEPLACGLSGDSGFLALEYLDLGGRGGDAAAALGRSLAALHRAEQPFFGWHRDNTIGRTPQPNPRSDDWMAFYGKSRLLFQARRLAERGAAGDLLEDCKQLVDRLPAFFDGYTPHPALLHGDLWAGNWGALGDGTPVVFDPASYYGDRETDLAMTELFGGFPAAFYSAYDASFPRHPGYRMRRPLYQFYHVLNHANLFGGGYLEQSRALLRRLLEIHP